MFCVSGVVGVGEHQKLLMLTDIIVWNIFQMGFVKSKYSVDFSNFFVLFDFFVKRSKRPDLFQKIVGKTQPVVCIKFLENFTTHKK